MTAYYNENNADVAKGLRELIDAGIVADGDVDARSIAEVTAGDLRGYTQCHFFAGIGGWSIALRIAGWPDTLPVWTGSCPCQPFSEAGKQLGFADARDLWPAWRNLIRECGPSVIFGEQVASVDGVVWADRTGADLEDEGYAFGSAVLVASGIGSPQKRKRFYFAAHAIGTDPRGRLTNRRGLAIPRTVEGLGPLEAWNGGFDSYGRVDNGVPGRVAKTIVGGFGNAIVPDLAAVFIESVAR